MALRLGPGEQVIFEGHPSWRSILGFYAKGAALVGVLVALVVILGQAVGRGPSTSLVAGVLLGGAVIIALVGFLRRAVTRYTVTTRRVHVRHGLLSREVQEARIEWVRDVSYRQSAWQRLLGVGDVDFDTAAADPDGYFVFAGVSRPERIAECVNRAGERHNGVVLGRRGNVGTG